MMQIGEVKNGITKDGRPKTIKKIHKGVWLVEHPGEETQQPYTVIIKKSTDKSGGVKQFSMEYFHITEKTTPNGASVKNHELVKVGHRPAGIYVQETQDKYKDVRVIEISHTDNPLETVSIEYDYSQGIKTTSIKRHTVKMHGLL